MDTPQIMDIDAPRIVEDRQRDIAGYRERFTQDAAPAGIPALWARFAAAAGGIPHAIDGPVYGVALNADEDCAFDYLAGIEVTQTEGLRAEFAHLRLAPQRYAVFEINEHISTIRSVLHTVYNHWLPNSGYTAAATPTFERYTETFDPQSGEGGFEIWLPIT
jgi:AraC family transcriptional regulator